jgi:hypothetical protein
MGCHSRESGNPETAEILDSRFRGNDKNRDFCIYYVNTIVSLKYNKKILRLK